MGRRSDYNADMYKQLEEVMGRLSKMEEESKKDHREIKRLNSEVKSLTKENGHLRGELSLVKEENRGLRAEVARLTEENRLLRDDNERMKRMLGNDSSNSSLPPSSDGPDKGQGKPANAYNGREKSKRKKGAQAGHKGTTLTAEAVERRIREGALEHRVEHVGIPSDDYVVRYRLDFEARAVATEIRIYKDDGGKYPVPSDLRTEVTYGKNVKAMAAHLYSEGVMSNDRICDFINSMTGGALSISTGSVYNACRRFSELCRGEMAAVEGSLANSEVLCTDATVVSNNGKKAYIRNFSNGESVIYVGMDNKKLETLRGLPLLGKFAGILEHDHETALYHFGTGHGECNVHLGRYLLKNTEETKNKWSRDLRSFLNGMNRCRKRAVEQGRACFTEEEIRRYYARYDEILADGDAQHEGTEGKYAKSEERKLLNRLKNYKDNHLLFLRNFAVPYSDNMSEKDLRICKNRQKMAGGFRTEGGLDMYCNIIGFIETVKRRKMNIFQSIGLLFDGTAVLA